MPRLITLPSELAHVRELSRDLQEGDIREMESLGVNPSHALFHSFKQSLLRRSALLDGKVIAMWGVGGTPLSLVGHPYLLTGNGIKGISSIRFVSIYRQEVNYMKQLFPVLENYVDASYTEAKRVLKMSGFHLDGARPLGPKGSLFQRFWMES